MEQMAKAAAAGTCADVVQGALKCVPNWFPSVSPRLLSQARLGASISDPLELADYDGIIIGTATRYGTIALQMKNFLDQSGPFWVKGALLDKVD